MFPETPMIKIKQGEPSNERKIEVIADHFKKIMQTLNLDLSNDSLENTPLRVAKMYVNEIFSGLQGSNFPKITTQDNSFKYDQMLIEKGIEINSVCEHHFVPIIGSCHIAYIPKDTVIGLSKLNRIAQYYASRPQVQERLTEQIKCKLVEILQTDDVAVCLDASHMCVKMRGIKDSNCITRTTSIGGLFKTSQETRIEFLTAIGKI